MNSFDIPKLNPKIKKSRKVIKRFIPVLLIVASVVFFAIVHAILSGPTEVVKTFFPGLTGLRSADNKVNILLLGLAGGRHDGAYLTDTVMVASYNLKTHQAYMISLPRDMWIPTNQSKINAIYETGLAQNNGLELAKTAIGNIVGLPIHYGLRVDFDGFVKAIDALDGIDINIDNGFNDYLYPITGKEDDLCGNKFEEREFNEEEAKKLNISSGKQEVLITADNKIATDSADPKMGDQYFSCRFEQLHFNAGETHLNGKTALKYVRSRKGTNDEGSDFARSKRQQKVLEAVRNKVLSLETLADPGRVSELINTFAKSIDTDITAKNALEFYKLSKNLDKTHSIVIDDSMRKNLPDGKKSLLYNPPTGDYDGVYVLVSQDDDYSTIQKYIALIMSGKDPENEASSSSRPSSK